MVVPPERPRGGPRPARVVRLRARTNVVTALSLLVVAVPPCVAGYLWFAEWSRYQDWQAATAQTLGTAVGTGARRAVNYRFAAGGKEWTKWEWDPDAAAFEAGGRRRPITVWYRPADPADSRTGPPPAGLHFPWGWGDVAPGTLKGLPYFLVVVPFTVRRLVRVRRLGELARGGLLVRAVVDWRPAMNRTKSGRVAMRVNGVSVGPPFGSAPDPNDPPFRFRVGGEEVLTYSRAGSGAYGSAPAARFPHGSDAWALYDPARPARAALLDLVRYYVTVDLPEADAAANGSAT
ncbi:MAG: hypothetical protein JWO31_751 [Phycisphaerales bacterium]|nr:hypothetical protein [Phycisphaerales bacterium]